MGTGNTSTVEDVVFILHTDQEDIQETAAYDRHKIIDSILNGRIPKVTNYTPIIGPDGNLTQAEPVIPYPPETTPIEEEDPTLTESIYNDYSDRSYQYGYASARQLIKDKVIPNTLPAPDTPYKRGFRDAIVSHTRSLDELNSAFSEGYQVAEQILEHTGLEGLISAIARINSTNIELPVNKGFLNGVRAYYFAKLEGTYETEEASPKKIKPVATNSEVKEPEYFAPVHVRDVTVHFGLTNATRQARVVYDSLQNTYLLEVLNTIGDSEFFMNISYEDAINFDKQVVEY